MPRQLGVEADGGPEAPREFLLHLQNGGFERRVAGSQKDCLPGPVGDLPQPFDGQVDPFLGFHAADEDYQGQEGIRVQGKGFEKSALVGLPLFQVVDEKVATRALSTVGSPLAGIQAIDNPPRVFWARLQVFFQPAAERGVVISRA